ncbi:MAG: diguanylate cyclase, partial [Candidatus Aerophobetes bacterium]|nr:diguanylate cyclase [Candidatus Aerophobetes bacterium]
MKDEYKRKDELINELVELRQQVAELEALESQRKQTEKVNKQLQALQQATTAVHSNLDLKKVFGQITDGIVYFMGYTTAFIIKLNDEKKRFEIKALSTKKWLLPQINKILGFSVVNFSCPANSKLSAAVRSAMKGKIVVAKTLVEIVYPLISKRVCLALQKLGKTKNYILVPLKVGSGVIGGIFITSPRKNFSKEELRIIKLFARAASHAINNANLHLQVKQTQEKLRKEHNLLKTLMDNIPDSIYFKDNKNRFVKVNRAKAEHSGTTPDEMVGKADFDFFSKEVAREAFADDNRVMESEKPLVDKVEKITYSDGTKHWVSATKVPWYDDKGRIVGTMGISRDISRRKRAEEKLTYIATHDALTGLPNRNLFSDRLSMAMAHAQREGKKVVVMMLDLDWFKRINDSLGHKVGDGLLQAVGSRLKDILRKTDTITRMGGDEFLLLLPNITQVEDAAKIAQKVLRTFQKPFIVNEREFNITTSIGIAVYPEHTEDAETLIRCAD